MYGYVINLARSVDRRKHITAELKKTGLEYEIITAVDGRELDLSDPSIVDPLLTTRTQFTPGVAGAALSHLSAYEKVLADGLDAVLVLEDDVTLPSDLSSLADSVAEQLTGAEIALLSCDSISTCKMSRQGAVVLEPARQLVLPIDVSQPMSAGAYIITREACERMSKFAPPVRVNSDFWWHFYREGILDRVRCVMPLPVRKNPNLISTMGSYSLGNSFAARMAWPVVNRKVPVLHQVLCYRRKRIYGQWSRAEFVDMPFVEKPSRLDP